MPHGTPILRTDRLTKRLFHRTVVDDVSMSIAAGEIYGLLGRNGAGKSTLMKLICGIAVPSSGRVEIIGEPIGLGTPHPFVGALIERPGFHSGMSGFDNVVCRALALGLPNPQDEADRALEICGLSSASRDKAGTYSLGMKQRLGISLALVGTPGLIVLDEPFNGIDIEGTLELRRVLSDLAMRKNTAVLISSHVADQLHHCVTRYGVMVGGRLVAEKTAEEADRECASFIAIRTSRPEVALVALEEALPDALATLAPDGSIHMDVSAGTSTVTRALFDAGIEDAGVYLREGDIAEYFAKLMAATSPLKDGGDRQP